MFYGEKDEVRNALHVMQRAVCCYDVLGLGNPPAFCDCKYGYDELVAKSAHYYSEQTGCPELRTVVELLDKMTEVEYNSILSRK